jgi:hypothetical protein
MEGIIMATSLATFLFNRFHFGHFGGGRGGADFVLLLAGLGFAGLLVWAIQRSGRSTT